MTRTLAKRIAIAVPVTCAIALTSYIIGGLVMIAVGAVAWKRR